MIKEHQPDYIFHLAAESTTRHDALFLNHHAISTGTINILETVRLWSPQTKVFLSGSALQFKNEGFPINENTAFEGSSPYAVARIHSVYTGRYYRNAFGLKVFTGYFFNHDSPRRSERHENQKIAAAVIRIKKGSNEKIEIGNIDVRKEFNYAGDIVKAVWTLVNQNNLFEAVIGSGKSHSIEEWTKYCFNKINKNWQDYVMIKDGFIPEYNNLVSDPAAINAIGWKSEFGIEELADIMMGEV